MKSILLVLGFLLSLQNSIAASMVYLPDDFKTAKAKVVVVIHGCLQSPESMALGSGWNQIADKNNLVMIYPQVPRGSNAIDCWTWYLPKNQDPKSGQLFDLRNEIQQWKTRLQVSQAATFVTGISSGAATAAGLISCFPKDFSAGAIHSGPAYGLAHSLQEANLLLQKGPQGFDSSKRLCDPSKFNKPVLVIQGLEDKVVNPHNVEQLETDFFGKAQLVTTVQKNSNGLNYKVKSYKANGAVMGQVVLIEGLGHSWAGYTENMRLPAILGPEGTHPTQVPFFSQEGPSSTNLIFDFFNKTTGNKNN